MFAYFVIEFTIFSVVGWMWESVLYTVLSGRPDNRGFLHGPICPIYGFGSIIAATLFEPLVGEPLKLFLISMIGSAILEYITSFVLEKFFDARWWDYSTIPFNIHGRICLSCSIAFGIAGVVLVPRAILPIIERVHMIPPFYADIIAILMAGFIGGDLFLSVSSVVDVGRMIDDILRECREKRNALGRKTGFRNGNSMKAEVQKRSLGLNKGQRYAIRSINRFVSDNKEKVIKLLKISVGYPLDRERRHESE
jgi:uncharacterized membrane protein